MEFIVIRDIQRLALTFGRLNNLSTESVVISLKKKKKSYNNELKIWTILKKSIYFDIREFICFNFAILHHDFQRTSKSVWILIRVTVQFIFESASLWISWDTDDENIIYFATFQNQTWQLSTACLIEPIPFLVASKVTNCDKWIRVCNSLEKKLLTCRHTDYNSIQFIIHGSIIALRMMTFKIWILLRR